MAHTRLGNWNNNIHNWANRSGVSVLPDAVFLQYALTQFAAEFPDTILCLNCNELRSCLWMMFSNLMLQITPQIFKWVEIRRLSYPWQVLNSQWISLLYHTAGPMTWCSVILKKTAFAVGRGPLNSAPPHLPIPWYTKRSSFFRFGQEFAIAPLHCMTYIPKLSEIAHVW